MCNQEEISIAQGSCPELAEIPRGAGTSHILTRPRPILTWPKEVTGLGGTGLERLKWNLELCSEFSTPIQFFQSLDLGFVWGALEEPLRVAPTPLLADFFSFLKNFFPLNLSWWNWFTLHKYTKIGAKSWNFFVPSNSPRLCDHLEWRHASSKPETLH